MNKQDIILIFVKSPAWAAALLLMLSLPCGMALGAEPEQAQANPASTPGETGSAEGGLNKAASALPHGEAAFNGSSQRTGQTTWSDAGNSSAQAGRMSRQAVQSDTRAEALQGAPESGYAGTWTDPATGDIITSVIAPTPSQNRYSQDYPIIIEPQVAPGNWGADYNSGWQNGWPQWGNYPGEPAYGTTPPPFPSYGPPPGVNPSQPPYRPGVNPWPPNGLGPNINPPFNNIPQHPGYRPLRPNRPYPGAQPPSGMTPPNNPGFQPPYPNPGWQQPMPHPGFEPGQNGFMPGNPPGWRPLPMQPGGGSWEPGPNPGIQPRRSF